MKFPLVDAKTSKQGRESAVLASEILIESDGTADNQGDQNKATDHFDEDSHLTLPGCRNQTGQYEMMLDQMIFKPPSLAASCSMRRTAIGFLARSDGQGETILRGRGWTHHMR
jgi:hypothetical protein